MLQHQLQGGEGSFFLGKVLPGSLAHHVACLERTARSSAQSGPLSKQITHAPFFRCRYTLQMTLDMLEQEKGATLGCIRQSANLCPIKLALQPHRPCRAPEQPFLCLSRRCEDTGHVPQHRRGKYLLCLEGSKLICAIDQCNFKESHASSTIVLDTSEH